MKNLFIILLFIGSFKSFAQIQGDGEVYLNGDLIDPVFNGGGLDKFYNYINAHFDFSKVTKKKGTMVAGFTVTETGEIKNIKILQFIDVESATEMIRVLKFSPKWQPARQNNKPVSVNLKILCSLNEIEFGLIFGEYLNKYIFVFNMPQIY